MQPLKTHGLEKFLEILDLPLGDHDGHLDISNVSEALELYFYLADKIKTF